MFKKNLAQFNFVVLFIVLNPCCSKRHVHYEVLKATMWFYKVLYGFKKALCDSKRFSILFLKKGPKYKDVNNYWSMHFRRLPISLQTRFRFA
jgi:hypothetical protein